MVNLQSEKKALERSLYRALTTTERKVSNLRGIPYLRKAFKKIYSWQRLSGLNDRATFKKKLTTNNFSVWSFALVLGSPPRPKNPAVIAWIHCFVNNEYRHRDDSSEIFSLNGYLERGLIAPFAPQLQAHAEDLYDQISVSDFCPSKSARQSIVEHALSSQMVSFENLVRRAVILEINILRLRKTLVGTSPAERYANFLKLCESRSYRISFHKKYPVLARLTHTKLENWKNSTVELIARLTADWLEICLTFDIDINDNVTGMSTGGDTHNSGRAVTTIDFYSGKSIVYKPRSISMENIFQKLVGYFNSKINDLDLRTIRVIDKNNYGWVEFIKAEEATSQQQMKAFFLKLGALTAITHTMHGVDFFFENVVASEDGPVFIDLETLFHQNADRKTAVSARDKTQLSLYDSVLGMGILPQPQQGANEGEVFDISVIGARKNQQAPYSVTGVTNSSRDDISIKKIPGWIPSTHSSPTEDKVSAEVRSSFLSGYDLVTNYILENKKEYLSGPIASFSKTIRRLIVRDTKTYGDLQIDESHPDLLRDQSEREWHWDNLWSELKRRPMLNKFIYSELQQVLHGDIPYFYGEVNCRTVTGSDNSKINLDDIIKKNPFELVRDNIEALNIDDIDKQRWYIGTSLGMIDARGLTGPVLHQEKGLYENSIVVGDFILTKLLHFDDESWFVATQNPTPGVTQNRAVSFLPASHGLYDGVAGVAYFLAVLEQATSKREYRFAAESLLKGLLTDIGNNFATNNSGFTGRASIVYVLDKLLMMWGDILDINKVIHSLLSKIKLEIEEEKNLDILNGIAGISLALLPYVSRSGNRVGIDILRIIKMKLNSAHKTLLKLDEPTQGLDYLRGFSHGLSGIALSLYRLSEYFEEQNSLSLSKKLILHEAELVGTSQWTDSHKFGSGPLTAWCHGAPGIVLALSKMPRLLEDPIVREYFDRALDYSFEAGLYDSACLCHGSLGNIDILKTAQLDSSRSEHIREITITVIDKLSAEGFSSFGNDQSFSLSLMTGISGLGYGLLRLSDTSTIPCVLSLE